MIPTESANANTTSQSSTSSAQGNMLQVYFKKFAEFPEDQKLSKRCSDAGFQEEIEKGQFFIAIEEGSDVMQTACREYVNSTPTNTARTELHSMTTSLHANTRGSRAGRLRIAHLSSTCHVSFLAAPDTDHEHKFPLTFLTYLSDSITNTHKTLVHDPYVLCEVPR